MKKKIDYKNKESSFTLIELLMVISIITLLISVLFSYIGSAHAKTRDAVRLSDIKQIGTAANLYYEDTGMLPTQIGPGDGGLVPKYLPSEPKDPKTGISYSFTRSSNTLVVGGKFETQMTEGDKDFKIIATAVGDVSSNILCSSQFASSTGCSAGVISGQVLGITGGYNKNDNGVVPPVDSISDCSETQVNKTCPSFVINGCYCGGGKYVNGLIWQYPNPNISKNWDEAKTYCEDMGWRLPTGSELINGLNYQYSSSGIGNSTGDFSELTFYWSGDQINIDSAYICSAYNGVGANCFSHNYGDVNVDKKGNNMFRCIR